MNSQKIRLCLLFFIPFFALFPPILERLRGLHAPEVTGYALLILALICLPVGCLLFASYMTRWRDNFFLKAARILLILFLFVLYLDLNFNAIKWFNSFFSEYTANAFLYYIITAALILVCAGFLFLAYKYEGKFIDFSAVLLLVAFVSSLFISAHSPLDNWSKPQKTQTAKTSSPTEIYLIFDALVGAEGIDKDLEGGRDLHKRIVDFYDKYKFRHFGRAFSRHLATIKSVPSSLNYIYNKDVNLTKKYIFRDKKINVQYLTKNKLFDEKMAAGKAVRVIQTPWMNFCRHEAVMSCSTLPMGNPLSRYTGELVHKHGDLNVSISAAYKLTQKHNLITRKITKSMFNYYLDNSKNNHEDLGAFANARHFFTSITFERWFDEFGESMESWDRGDVIFAHFLFPHYPFRVDENCAPIGNWRYGATGKLKQKLKLTGEKFAQVRASAFEKYFKQVHCVYKKLDDLMKRINASEKHKDATIVLLGDHGSKISAGFVAGMLEARDIIDNQSALFSIRRSDLEPGYDPRQISVQQLFTASQTKDFSAELEQIERTFIHQTGKPRSAVMPQF